LQKRLNLNLTQIDIQEENFALNLQNAKINDINAKILKGDFREFYTKKRFDYIISNPPFYNSKSKTSIKPHVKVSRYQEYLPLEEFIKKSNTLLAPRGELIFCYKSDFLQDILFLFQVYKLRATMVKFVYNKRDNSNASLLLISAKKSSKNSTKILKPLYIFQGKMHSNEYRSIIESIGAYSIKCAI
jgi:tRNA1(Val) A37 N6-methylase TrmN6